VTGDWRLRTALALVAVLLWVSPSAAALTESARLAAVYDAILATQFDRVEALRKQACPPAPLEACAALEVVSLWWQIQIEPENRALDRAFEQLAAAAIAKAAAWTTREPNRGEAWFYLAGSDAPLVQWRVLRGQRLAAAREGNKIREALERFSSIQVSTMRTSESGCITTMPTSRRPRRRCCAGCCFSRAAIA
jgi:hypothetical protein